MADIKTKEQRSFNMSRIRSKDTKPEAVVRKYLFQKGLRYRKNDRRYPGKPDIVLPKYRTMIFVNGCFWHAHEGCSLFKIPQSNTDFWIEKLQANKSRDAEIYKQLKGLNWRVLVVWECQLKNRMIREDTLKSLYDEIVNRSTSAFEVI